MTIQPFAWALLTGVTHRLITTTDRYATDRGMAHMRDRPLLGRLFWRRPFGTRSKSVKTLMELEDICDAARQRLNVLKKVENADLDELNGLANEIWAMEPDLRVLEDVEEPYALSKLERSKASPNWAEIDKIDRQMARIARDYAASRTSVIDEMTVQEARQHGQPGAHAGAGMAI